MTPKELSQLLNQEVDTVVRHLLPNGKRDGAEWCVGSVTGEEGQSLKVRLSGTKAGVWKDFAEGHGGDLIDLWAQVKGISLTEAIGEAKKFLGIEETKFYGHRSREYSKPTVPKCSTPAQGSPAFRYLTESRKLTPETIAKYKIADAGDSIVFPFIRDKKPVMIKKLKLERVGGKKDIRPTSKNQEPCLFGWQAIPENAREVTICEGEIDAASLFQLGFPALSVPFGGGTGAKQDWIENEFDRLQRFDTIYLCLDQDEAGQTAVSEITERLGRHRCKIVSLPHKDANDCLKNGLDPLDMARFFGDAGTVDPSELKSSSEFDADVIKEFYPPPGFDVGFRTPWKKVGDRLMFRPGEVTVLAGVNGHGKSEGAGHITLDALRQDVKSCVASLEFKPQKWLYRMTRQASGLMNPSIQYIQAIQNWISGKLWVFDVVGTAKSKQIIKVFEYARVRYGIKLFIIDNLSKLDIDTDDYNRQRDFVDGLTDFAKEHNCHVILVTHMRKGRDDNQPAGKMDIKGAGAITDLVDTVLVWWRNRPKEQKIRSAGAEGVDKKVLQKPDAVVRCEKQRNGEDEPAIMLWFDKESHQFLESPDQQARRYVDYSTRSSK